MTKSKPTLIRRI